MNDEPVPQAAQFLLQLAMSVRAAARADAGVGESRVTARLNRIAISMTLTYT